MGARTPRTRQRATPLPSWRALVWKNGSAAERKSGNQQKDAPCHSPDYVMALQSNKAIVRPSLVPRLEPSLPAPSLRHIKFSPIFQSGSSVPPSQTPNISSFEPNFVNFSSKDTAQMPHSMPTARGRDLQLRCPTLCQQHAGGICLFTAFAWLRAPQGPSLSLRNQHGAQQSTRSGAGQRTAASLRALKA